MKMVELENMHT